MAVSNEEILSFLAANPNMSDADIAYNMVQNGIDPNQVIQATGMSPAEGMQRFSGALEQLGMPMTGLGGREQAAMKGRDSALAALAAANAQARGDITGARDMATSQAQGSFDQARGFFQPYSQGGQQAFQQQLALSGALGQDRFNAANMESPYVRFLQEEGERAVTRNASALGGLGGGNVQLELQRRGQGLAGQGLQQQFNNLGQMSGMGFNAASGMAGLSGTQAQIVPGLTMSAGQNLANSANAFGQNAAQMQYGTGQFLGTGRTDAGNLLAGNYNQVTNNLANLAAGQGQGISDIYGAGTGNLANLLTGYGQGAANIGMQGANMFSGLPGVPGVQQTQGALQGIGQAAEGIGTLMALSDIRLKDEIRHIASVEGINIYSWEWKPEYLHITQGMPTSGVIAQELMQTNPDAVFEHDSGFLAVDYSKVN
jgi:hypothetical protein